jgi:hypothetical protein
VSSTLPSVPAAGVSSGDDAGVGHATLGRDGHLHRFLLVASHRRPATGLFLASAVLVMASGLIHLYLWHLAYRHIATLGPLFLVQAAAALLLAVLLATLRRGLVLLAALSLMAGTIVGFILVTTVGLFGFTLTVITGWADLALATEAAAVALLLGAAPLLWRSSRWSGSES